jgi:hypothetical protein
VVNARLLGEANTGDAAGFGMLPALGAQDDGPKLVIRRDGPGWQLAWQSDTGQGHVPLPGHVDMADFQQFRCTRRGNELRVAFEAEVLTTLTIGGGPARLGLFTSHAAAEFDMVRVTAIGPL